MRTRNSLHIRLGISYSAVSEVASEWTPAQLFAASEQGAWYDPSDSSTVFQDAACTTPAGVGDVVGCIQDKSGNGNHVTQSTTAFKPILRQDGNSNYYLDFDGFDDILNAPFSPTDFPLIVASGTDTTGNDGSSDSIISLSRSTVGDPIIALFGTYDNGGNDAARLLYYRDVGFVFDTFINGSVGKKVLIARVYSGSQDVVLNDSTTSTAINENTFPVGLDRLSLGGIGDSTPAFFPGAIYQAVYGLFQLSTDEQTNLTEYIAAKSGVSL